MPPLEILLAIALPVLGFLGAFAAIKNAKRDSAPKPTAESWHDNSLQDWRRERDALATAERESRVKEAGVRAELSDGRAEDEETPVRHQRIGG